MKVVDYRIKKIKKWSTLEEVDSNILLAVSQEELQFP